MPTTNGLSTVIALLDTLNPFTQQTAGEGQGVRLKQIEDVVVLDTTGTASTSSYYRAARLPANAKVKRIDVFTDAAADTNVSSTLQLEFGVIFSDSTIDGTPQAYQGLAPAKQANGTTVAVTDATNRNALFGVVAQGNNAAIPLTEITFKGSTTTGATLLNLVQKGLAKIFGFVTLQGYDVNCPGFMDIYVAIKAVAATPAQANLFIRVQYAE